ncbi:hypothetical protein QJS10_CPB12g01419 [Acorus calamus]|uniref:Uncharacterized protein n=1 Tax=Acorus calamus TaxID=4465 RepID=A0AAV9DPE5_ACOCL|nr:hypothetical protein QJS10_CPB12g01419 [Acorus calamus]
MEVDVGAGTSASPPGLRSAPEAGIAASSPEILRVKKRALKAVLEHCRRALDVIDSIDGGDEGSDGSGSSGKGEAGGVDEEEEEGSGGGDECSGCDSDTDELCDLLKSRVESPNFLEKLGSMHMSVSHNISEEGTSWDVISDTDLWQEHNDGEDGSDQEDYVLVKQEDIVDGIACFMAAYLLSLKQTKELTPTQLQEALSKTFSVKKKKGKLRKAWDGSKVIYNVASWGATAIGIYQNPAIIRAATVAFWTSCRVISKLF